MCQDTRGRRRLHDVLHVVVNYVSSNYSVFQSNTNYSGQESDCLQHEIKKRLPFSKLREWIEHRIRQLVQCRFIKALSSNITTDVSHITYPHFTQLKKLTTYFSPISVVVGQFSAGDYPSRCVDFVSKIVVDIDWWELHDCHDHLDMKSSHHHCHYHQCQQPQVLDDSPPTVVIAVETTRLESTFVNEE